MVFAAAADLCGRGSQRLAIRPKSSWLRRSRSRISGG